jgi:prophage DNA circulation protein
MAITIPPWEKALRPATIRAVAIEVEQRDETGGRNVATHEYIDSDDIYTEDLSRKKDGWSVDAYLWGDDYLDRLETLRTALRKGGACEYVDPWRGRQMVHVAGWSIRETRKDGGWAAIRLDLVEAGTKDLPTVTRDTRVAVSEAATAAQAVEPAALGRAFDISGPSLLVEDAAALLSDAQTQMDELAAPLASVGRTLASYQRQAAALKGRIQSLIATPAGLASRWQGLLGSYLGLTGWDGFGAYARWLGGSSASTTTSSTAVQAASGGAAALALSSTTDSWGAVAPTTTTRARQAANRSGLSAMIRRTALVEAARASAAMEWDTVDAAVTTRTTLTQALTAEIRATTDDEVKAVLRPLMAAVVRDITTRAADLTRLVAITPADTQPALVLAHTLWGDPARAAEILTRNPIIRDPLAVPGGRAISVVAR